MVNTMTRVWWIFALILTGLLPAQPPVQNAQRKFPSQPAAWVDPIKAEPPGTHYKTFPSKLAAASQLASPEVSYLIYLPPGYASDSAKRYPVVY